MGLFSPPPAPKAPDPPPPPAQVDVSASQADERRKLAQRQGFSSTIVAGNAAAPLTGQTRAATLVGQK